MARRALPATAFAGALPQPSDSDNPEVLSFLEATLPQYRHGSHRVLGQRIEPHLILAGLQDAQEALLEGSDDVARCQVALEDAQLHPCTMRRQDCRQRALGGR